MLNITILKHCIELPEELQSLTENTLPSQNSVDNVSTQVKTNPAPEKPAENPTARTIAYLDVAKDSSSGTLSSLAANASLGAKRSPTTTNRIENPPTGSSPSLFDQFGLRNIGGRKVKPDLLGPTKFRELMRFVTNPVVVVSSIHLPNVPNLLKLPRIEPGNDRKKVVLALPRPQQHDEGLIGPSLQKADTSDVDVVVANEAEVEVEDATPVVHNSMAKPTATAHYATAVKNEVQDPELSVHTTITATVSEQSSNDEKTPASRIPDPVPRAMTISSFSSMSVHPRPTVMFNINLPSHTYEAIVSSRRFNIHVLADTLEGAQIAKQLSQGHSRLDKQPASPRGYLQIAGRKHWIADWERHVARVQKSQQHNQWTPVSKLAVPIIQDPGVLYVLRCRVRKRMQAGCESRKRDKSGIIPMDNNTAIIVGEVEEVIESGSGIPEGSIGLAYAQQSYRKRGEIHNIPRTAYEILAEERKRRKAKFSLQEREERSDDIVRIKPEKSNFK